MQENLILCDAHVHIYPQFDLTNAIKNSISNFTKIEKVKHLQNESIKVWLLTEGQDYDFFTRQYTLNNDYVIKKTGENESLIIINKHTDKPLLYIIAGRQVVTREKLEICALATQYNQKDRTLNTRDTIKSVLDFGGIPALNWAPGKWFFSRGKIVRDVIENSNPESLLISETTMRPTIWPTPSLMKIAIKKGYKVIAGSDPLPFMKEENLIGSYCTLLTGKFDPEKPADSLRKLLLSSADIKRFGKRSGPLTFTKRQFNIMLYNKMPRKT
ncbi:hypothetical protein JXQ31_05005 [candidate division KSB1 bacterium]|nr:hypothetical protein [candidate division KSB1 bacterium]